MRFMNLHYIKRFRMELDLRRWERPRIELPLDYRLVAWDPAILLAHAEVKFQSFRHEIDAEVFPCLGELDGCEQLMAEIEAKEGFMPEGTWLAEYIGLAESVGIGESARTECCGTIQAVRTGVDKASIQNIGVSPFHRGRGIGTALILASILGQQHLGMRTVCLEVTAENEGAVRLYRQLGFRTVRTLYKAVELAYSEAGR